MTIDVTRQGPDLKDRQRQQGISARRQMPEDLRAAYSRKVVQRILESPEFEGARTILSYRAVNGELSLDGLRQAASRLGKRLTYPRCVSRTEMVALLPTAADCWQSGSFGILEPVPEKSQLIAPGDIDLVLCPCTVFDEQGRRLGMGGGYYDRYLPQCNKAIIAAVAFELQKAGKVLTEDWDYPMRIIFTEAAVYRN